MSYPNLTGGNLPYKNPTPGHVPVRAITIVPSSMNPNETAIDRISECGINVVGTSNSESYINSVLNLIENKNIKANISLRGSLISTISETINKYKSNKNVGCWDLADEPCYEALSDLGLLVRKIYSTDPNHMCVVNLSPSATSCANPPKEYTYNELIEAAQFNLMPAVWSFDYYPIREGIPSNPLSDSKKKEVLNKYYELLDLFHYISKKTERPFWIVSQTMATEFPLQEKSPNWYGNMPSTSLAYLRYQVFTALAYGAQGVSFWTYALRWCPRVSDYSFPTEKYWNEISADERDKYREIYTNAPINQYGEKTNGWNVVKTVVDEIRLYEKVFYECSVQDVRFTGSNLPLNAKTLTLPFGMISEFTCESDGALLSWIKNNGKNYLVIVNRSPYKQQIYSIKFSSGAIVTTMSPIIPYPVIPDEATSTKYILPAGGYVIYSW